MWRREKGKGRKRREKRDYNCPAWRGEKGKGKKEEKKGKRLTPTALRGDEKREGKVRLETSSGKE